MSRWWHAQTPAKRHSELGRRSVLGVKVHLSQHLCLQQTTCCVKVADGVELGLMFHGVRGAWISFQLELLFSFLPRGNTVVDTPLIVVALQRGFFVWRARGIEPISTETCKECGAARTDELDVEKLAGEGLRQGELALMQLSNSRRTGIAAECRALRILNSESLMSVVSVGVENADSHRAEMI
eukprot:3035403-Amphidinium_carterae.1